MSVTEQDIKNLAPQHRIVWKEPPGQPVEMGLYVDEDGHLCTDIGHVVRYKDGFVPIRGLARIVRIIEPAFIPRRGLVIGHPEDAWDLLACFGPDKWLTRNEFCSEWLTDDDARNLIENHGWLIVDDLTKEKSDE